MLQLFVGCSFRGDLMNRFTGMGIKLDLESVNFSFLRKYGNRSVFDLIPIIITILIFIPITNQPTHNRLAENQPLVGLHCLNEYDNEDEKWEWFRDRILT